MTARIANVLSIAGSDPSGGAGVQADLKTFAALGCYGMAAITALTAQNTRGVRAVHVPPAEFVAAEIDMIFEDVTVDAVKIGMVANPEIARAIAGRLAHWRPERVVLDPVLVATSGDSLGSDGVAEALIAGLLPLATVVTPNIPEACALVGRPLAAGLDDMRAAGEALLARGARAVLVKGGHAEGTEAIDLLVTPEGVRSFAAPRVATRNTHGTGCTLSSAIAALLAQGHELAEAVSRAKSYISGALAAADRLSVGSGHGPLNHLHALWRA
jgi:hydroxymethylpyrimidine/phosphomethylpyrimidine kinase